jgi:hypothetical protein
MVTAELMNNTYYVYICKDCKVEIHKKYFEVPWLRDVHRTLRLVVDADTNKVIRKEKAKTYKEPELRDDIRIFVHKKYREHEYGQTVDKSIAIRH